MSFGFLWTEYRVGLSLLFFRWNLRSYASCQDSYFFSPCSQKMIQFSSIPFESSFSGDRQLALQIKMLSSQKKRMSTEFNFDEELSKLANTTRPLFEGFRSTWSGYFLKSGSKSLRCCFCKCFFIFFYRSHAHEFRDWNWNASQGFGRKLSMNHEIVRLGFLLRNRYTDVYFSSWFKDQIANKVDFRLYDKLPITTK